MILAGVSLVLGFVEHPIEHFLVGMRFRPIRFSMSPNMAAASDWLLIMGVSAGLFGIALAWFEYGRKGASRNGFLSYFPAIWKLFDLRWFMDIFYRKSLDTFVYGGLTSPFHQKRPPHNRRRYRWDMLFYRRQRAPFQLPSVRNASVQPADNGFGGRGRSSLFPDLG